jgi:hypothetical protein
MLASIHPFVPPARRTRDAGAAGVARPARPTPAPTADGPTWLVDATALEHCRAVLLGRHEQLELRMLGRRAPQSVPMSVPPAFDRFCRTHFASVRRLHPTLAWDDACPAYAIALAAHAALCVSFDEAQERLLERHWDRIRGESTLAWAQARPLIAAGCSALDRLDPLAMHR